MAGASQAWGRAILGLKWLHREWVIPLLPAHFSWRQIPRSFRHVHLTRPSADDAKLVLFFSQPCSPSLGRGQGSCLVHALHIHPAPQSLNTKNPFLPWTEKVPLWQAVQVWFQPCATATAKTPRQNYGDRGIGTRCLWCRSWLFLPRKPCEAFCKPQRAMGNECLKGDWDCIGRRRSGHANAHIWLPKHIHGTNR